MVVTKIMPGYYKVTKGEKTFIVERAEGRWYIRPWVNRPAGLYLEEATENTKTLKDAVEILVKSP